MNNEPDMLFVYEPAKTIPPQTNQKSRHALRLLFLIETIALIVGAMTFRIVILPRISFLHERPETIVRVFFCSFLALAGAVALTFWRPSIRPR